MSLVNNHSTAVRNVTEYNFGLVFSAEPLKDDEVFQVCIDKKVGVEPVVFGLVLLASSL